MESTDGRSRRGREAFVLRSDSEGLPSLLLHQRGMGAGPAGALSQRAC